MVFHIREGAIAHLRDYIGPDERYVNEDSGYIVAR